MPQPTRPPIFDQPRNPGGMTTARNNRSFMTNNSSSVSNSRSFLGNSSSSLSSSRSFFGNNSSILGSSTSSFLSSSSSYRNIFTRSSGLYVLRDRSQTWLTPANNAPTMKKTAAVKKTVVVKKTTTVKKTTATNAVAKRKREDDDDDDVGAYCARCRDSLDEMLDNGRHLNAARCGHFFCSDCKDSLKKTSKCQRCGKLVKEVRRLYVV